MVCVDSLLTFSSSFLLVERRGTGGGVLALLLASLGIEGVGEVISC